MQPRDQRVQRPRLPARERHGAARHEHRRAGGGDSTTQRAWPGSARRRPTRPALAPNARPRHADAVSAASRRWQPSAEASVPSPAPARPDPADRRRRRRDRRRRPGVASCACAEDSAVCGADSVARQVAIRLSDWLRTRAAAQDAGCAARGCERSATSAAVSRRCAPARGRRAQRPEGDPLEAAHRCPTCSHIRLTWRLRPSWIVSSIVSAARAAGRGPARCGRPRARPRRAARGARARATGGRRRPRRGRSWAPRSSDG